MEEDIAEAIRARLTLLREEHQAMDSAIHAMQALGTANHLEIQRLKKRKLQLKDEIARLEDKLYPDIIA